MTQRPPGRTGFQATDLGIGDLANRTVPIETCVATLRRALDFGLNLVDTAPGCENGYGEQIIGAALKGRREGVFVIDKIDRLNQPVAPQVEASLAALGMEAVDLFVFHAVSDLAQWERPGRGYGGARPMRGSRQGPVPWHLQSQPRYGMIP